MKKDIMTGIKYVFKDDDNEEPQQDKRPPGRPKGTTGIPRRSKKDLINYDSIEKMYSFGLTDEQVADVLEISPQSIVDWKKNKLFLEAQVNGKEYWDNKVEMSLAQRAVGYKHFEEDVRVCDKEIVRTIVLKHYPPDTAAASLWLRNRRPKEWRDKQDIEMTGKDGGPVTMKIVYEDKTLPDGKGED
jgi:hypothetical protein